MFNDSSTSFFCRIYYAEEFLKLRRLIWPRGEEAYVRSLAHCVQWAARGGKSGSTFCKSRGIFINFEVLVSLVSIFAQNNPIFWCALYLFAV